MTSKINSVLRCLVQLAAICGLLLLCNWLVGIVNFPVPGSILGLAILVILLATKVIPESAIKTGANWLIGELLLFFVPPVISVLKYQVLLRQDGLTIVATVIIGTVIALVGTAWVVDKVFKLEKQLNQRLDRLIKGAAHV
ncbi:CidA/LrgA family protein [Catenovulum sp. 2E275]|uniref:CidA/LrgA family protein n=1 Tax=Catenovulum sp. 2E275 TaxID=2980497 RepID=UPI0021D1F171|nr:CidA/LrgA family protein [Catenovulum sp. 2E275]MCU4675070.1 CidA/LrgA family protein [Catenovulum sp. 2E275]